MAHSGGDCAGDYWLGLGRARLAGADAHHAPARFCRSSRASGEGPLRIIFSEILPNEIAIVCSSLIFTILYAILAEIGLEFLGLSDVNATSWGNILFWATNGNALLLEAWWWFAPAGLCIAVLGAGLAL